MAAATATYGAADRIGALDAIRAFAAIAVCAGHARSFVLVDWDRARATNLFDALFYFATGLGHQAVVVFFVLSGYFVGGAVASAWQSGRWSWSVYALNRLSRLWVVLLPALFLTLTLDAIGAWLSGGAAYAGLYHGLIASGPEPGMPVRHDATAFLANLAFLQTITAPVYGSNGPLWSLANEFWYYVLFPLLWQAIAARDRSRWVAAGLFGAVVYALPWHIVSPGLIWLLGFVAWRFGQHPAIRRNASDGRWLTAACALLLASLCSSKTALAGSDYAIGIATALVVAAIGARAGARKTTSRLPLPDFSYTLYLTHFPLLALLWFSWLAPAKFQPDADGYAVFVGFLTLALLCGLGWWWLFERNTAAVRSAIRGRVTRWARR